MSSSSQPRQSSDITPSKSSTAKTPNFYNPFSPNQDPQHGSPSVDNNYKSIPVPNRSHGKASKKGAMDPFEVRIRFTQHLQHLNASVTSANKAAQYAIKYRDMDEDLHSCILEQLERVCLLFLGY
jgi:hypothetical protein